MSLGALFKWLLPDSLHDVLINIVNRPSSAYVSVDVKIHLLYEQMTRTCAKLDGSDGKKTTELNFMGLLFWCFTPEWALNSLVPTASLKHIK